MRARCAECIPRPDVIGAAGHRGRHRCAQDRVWQTRRRSHLAPGEAQLAFERVAPGEFAPGEWDAIVVADVLYLLSPSSKRELLKAMVEHLAPGGAFIVKETDTRPAWKFTINRMQEFTADAHPAHHPRSNARL